MKLNKYTRVSKKQTGFTLIELVITLLIVSTLTIFVTVNWPGQTMNLRAQVDQLAQDIRYAQSLAMASEQRVRINLAANGYRYSDRQDAVGINHPATGNTQPMYFKSAVTLSSPEAFVVFDELGAPYVTGALPGTALAANLAITLTANGESRVIFISPETGRVVVL